MAQMVLVFAADLLDRIGRFQGYCLDVDHYVKTLLDPANNRFMERDLAERDPRFKQIIPYVVLRFRDSVFSYVRGKKASESRLRAMRSIGLGGHIEPADRSLFQSDEVLYGEAARREVEEEVDLRSTYRERVVGLLNDDSTEVGRVHFGIVHVWDLAEPSAQKREGQITQSGFVSLSDLPADDDQLETWSQLTRRILEDPRTPRYRPPGKAIG